MPARSAETSGDEHKGVARYRGDRPRTIDSSSSVKADVPKGKVTGS
jgi:hypothetical protein